MTFDKTTLHNLSIDLLYAGIVLITFVIIERLLYYIYLSVQSKRIARAIRLTERDTATSIRGIPPKDVVVRSMVEYIDVQEAPGVQRARVEDVSAALFLRVDTKVNARLWMLDTLVTAAPLLGLLGAILGIMDTFNALSAGGISDPGAVSRGIGSALFATAIGIATALYGLLGHNILHRRAEGLTDAFKSYLLEATY